MPSRPDWDDYFLKMAQLAASRATCLRRHVGAVLVREHRVIATGYNGSISGDPHCEDVGCLMENGHCIRCIHAELSVLLQCATSSQTSARATLYSTDLPCLHCAKALIQGGVVRVVYLKDYPDENSVALLHAAGVAMVRAREEDGAFIFEEEGRNSNADENDSAAETEQPYADT